MSQRKCIHLPVERHEQFRKVADTHGFSNLSDYLESLISEEAACLGFELDIVLVAPLPDGNISICVRDMPDMYVTPKQAELIKEQLSQVISGNPSFNIGFGYEVWDLCPNFYRLGKGYRLIYSTGYDHAGHLYTNYITPTYSRGFSPKLASEFALMLISGIDAALMRLNKASNSD